MKNIIKKHLLFCIIFSLVLNLLNINYCNASANLNTKTKNISLKMGDYIQLGNYNKKAITWKVLDINSNGVLITSDKIISLKAFDAAECGNADAHTNNSANYDTMDNGNSTWETSNIREWLNGNSNTVNYSTKAPTIAAVKSHTNDYDKEAGFLTNFTNKQLDLIKDTEIKTKSVNPSGYSYTKDKVFLLSGDEWIKYLKLDSNTGLAYPTQEAVNKTVIKDKNQEKPDPNQYWFYWLRDPYNDLTHTSYVYIDGLIHSTHPDSGICGVRPAMYLKSRNVTALENGTGKNIAPYNLNNSMYSNTVDPNIVTFKDNNVESAIRLALYKPTGSISKDDMKNIKSIFLSGEIKSIDGLQYAVNLTSLNLYAQDNNPIDLSPLSGLSNLSYASLQYNEYSDKNTFNLAPLSKCPKLNMLSLFNCKIDFDNLSKLRSLFNLELSNNHIKDFSKLLKCTFLFNLTLNEEDISDLSQLKKMPNLSGLDLRKSYNLSFLAGSKIKYLGLSTLDKAETKYISNMKLLETLSINGGNINNLNFISQKNSLTHLWLSNLNFLTDLNQISNLKHLLSISLCSLPNLKSLKFLKDLDSIESIDFSGDHIDSIDEICKCKSANSIKSLSLSYNNIKSISSINALKELNSLYLNDNNISDLKPLYHLKNLNKIDIRRNTITKTQITDLQKALPGASITTDIITDTTTSTSNQTTKNIATKNISITKGDYIQFGHYNGKPITWNVLDINSNGVLVISDKLISFKAFDAAEGGSVSDKSNDINYSDPKECGDSTWGKSNLREWLNSNNGSWMVHYSTFPPEYNAIAYHTNQYNDEAGFLTNFTKGENDFINQTTVKTITIKPNVYTTTSDKVFLLSADEWNKYLKGDSDTGLAYPTQEAINNTIIKDSIQEKPDINQYWFYWLRDPYKDLGHASYVYNDSLIHRAHPNSGICGVRPVMYLRSRNVTVLTSGNGSKSNPYQIIIK